MSTFNENAVNRVSAGTAEGGRFAAKPHSEAGELDLGQPENRFAPSVFDPSEHNVTFVEAADLFAEESTSTYLGELSEGMAPEAVDRGGLYVCTVCGHRLRYTVVYDSDMGRFCVGEDCAETLEIASFAGKSLAQLRQKAAGDRERQRAVEFRRMQLEDNPDLADALELRDRSEFLDDLYDKAGSYQLSKRQVAAAVRTAKKIRDRDAAKAAWDAREKMPVPEGKQTVTGVVRSMRWDEKYFGGRPTSTLKMLVEDDRGFKVWMTAPSSLSYQLDGGSDVMRESTSGSDDVTGARVEVTATLTRSDRDEYFGFGSRPGRKTKILTPARVHDSNAGWIGPGEVKDALEHWEMVAAGTHNTEYRKEAAQKAASLRSRAAALFGEDISAGLDDDVA